MKLVIAIIGMLTISFSLESFALNKTQSKYCIFDLYGSLADWATSAEAVCTSGLSFSTGEYFALKSSADYNLIKAERALSLEGYVSVNNFELQPEKAHYWRLFRLFKKGQQNDTQEICLMSTKKKVLIGCTQGSSAIQNLVKSSAADLEANLIDNGFIETSTITGKNIFKNDVVKIFER